MTEQKKQRIHILVSGIVQGVGYRYYCRNEAKNLGISGWVRNLPTGQVELEAESSSRTLDQFVERLKDGHAWAHVKSCDIHEIKEKGSAEFDIQI